MPEYVQVGTTQASVKCLSLWNGTTNDAPPTGWDQPGYDDSGWSLSAAVSIPSSSTLTYPNNVTVTLGAGLVEPVAPFTTPPSPFAQWLNRWTFVQPPDPYLFYMTNSSGSATAVQPATLNGTLGYSYEVYGTALTSAKNFDQTGLNGPSSTNLLAWQQQGEGDAFTYVFFVFYTIDTGGRPVAWGTVTPGVNDQGVLGIGNLETTLVPTYMDTRYFPDPDNPNVIRIASNGKTTFALDTYGDLYSCGDNTGFMLGTNDSTKLVDSHLLRDRVGNGLMVGNTIDVKVGGDCLIALTRPGGLFVAGLNAHGSCGLGHTTSMPGWVRAVPGGPFNANLFIGAGEAHSVYGTGAGANAAGDNQYGQIGDGTTTDRTFFTAATGIGESALDLAVGGNSNWLLTDAGGGITSQFVWGRAQFGSLGLEAYDAGTGPSHIVSTPLEITPFSATGDLQIHDQITVVYEPLVTSGVAITTAGIVGDGVPYGGAADGDGTIVYGTLIGTEGTGSILTSPTTTVDNIVGLAESGGLLNEWASGDSKATLAAISREYELEIAVNESYTGVALIQASGSQSQYFWPNGDPTQVYVLPDDTREVTFTVTNIPGGGTNVTVRMNLDVYNGQLPTGGIVSTVGQNVTSGNTRTLDLEALSMPPVFGLQAYLTYTGSPPMTNTVNASLQVRTVSGTNDVLYTWGYGGYGQMGNGLTTATNLFAISENGLGNVRQVCLARRVAFAVAETGAVRPVGAGRSWATVVG